MEGPGVARYTSTARDLGAFICFEDEAGQGLKPPKGRTWAPRGARPLVRVRGAGGGRVSIAGVACYRPGDRPHLFYKLRVHRRRKGEPKGFAWRDYRDLITSAHHGLSAPLVWVWDYVPRNIIPDQDDRGMQFLVRGGDQAGVIGFGHRAALALAAAVDADPVEQVAPRAGPQAHQPRG